jgi:hypothetical protein
MQTRVLMSFLSAISVLSGCAAPYVAPPPESSAQVRIVYEQADVFESLAAIGYSSGSCKNPIHLGMIGGLRSIGGAANSSLKIPGGGEFKQGSTLERAIGVEREYLIKFELLNASNKEGFGTAGKCTLSVKFVPKTGDKYEFVLSRQRRECRLTAQQIVQEESGQIRRLKLEIAKEAEDCAI